MTEKTWLDWYYWDESTYFIDVFRCEEAEDVKAVMFFLITASLKLSIKKS